MHGGFLPSSLARFHCVGTERSAHAVHQLGQSFHLLKGPAVCIRPLRLPRSGLSDGGGAALNLLALRCFHESRGPLGLAMPALFIPEALFIWDCCFPTPGAGPIQPRCSAAGGLVVGPMALALDNADSDVIFGHSQALALGSHGSLMTISRTRHYSFNLSHSWVQSRLRSGFCCRLSSVFDPF